MQIGWYISLLKSQQPGQTERKKLVTLTASFFIVSCWPGCWLEWEGWRRSTSSQGRHLADQTWGRTWGFYWQPWQQRCQNGDIFISRYLALALVISCSILVGLLSSHPSSILVKCLTAKTDSCERSNISIFSWKFSGQQKFCTSEKYFFA